jgi:hypothetical protein
MTTCPPPEKKITNGVGGLYLFVTVKKAILIYELLHKCSFLIMLILTLYMITAYLNALHLVYKLRRLDIICQ